MQTLFSSRQRLVYIVATLVGVVGLCSPSGFGEPKNPKCIRVTGFYEERIVTSGCTSSVGLCTEYHYQGNLTGDNFFTATNVLTSTDTATTAVVFATGDSILSNVHVAGRRGTLTIKNAAVFHTAGEGELLDVQTIISGSDDLAGATGVIRTVGTFVDGAGRSVFDGFVCVP
jgi:hypothetical protein